MAKCTSCDAEISAQAERCPRCATPVPNPAKTIILGTQPWAGGPPLSAQLGQSLAPTLPEGDLSIDQLLNADAPTVQDDQLAAQAMAAQALSKTLTPQMMSATLSGVGPQPAQAPRVDRLSGLYPEGLRGGGEAARRPAQHSAPVVGLASPGVGPGELVEGYRIESEIGQGGMGRVFRAVHGVTGQVVALKMLLPELSRDERLRSRFLNEAQVLARLDHPNLVPLLSFMESAGNTFIVMPFVEGETLERLIQREGRLPLGRVAEITDQIAQALHYIHGQRVMHRDLKPSNILIRPDGGVRLMDFGIARAIGAQRLTRAGMVVGTAEYLAPEQASGQSHDDPRSEIYGLAVLAYEMVTGRPPFTHPKATEVLLRQVQDPPPPPRMIRTELPLQAQAAILWGLEKDPARRPASPVDFAQALREGLEGKAPAQQKKPAPKEKSKEKGKAKKGDPAAPAVRVFPRVIGRRAKKESAGIEPAETLLQPPRQSMWLLIIVGILAGTLMALLLGRLL